jgi:hypothetical protein
MPNFKDIIEGLKEILKLIYGENAPSWILPLIGYVLLGAVLLVGLLALLTVLSKIKDLLADKFWPLFYDKEKQRRSDKRRRFADHVESELRRLNNLEAWSDYRFAELEAEVDAEGRKRLFGVFPSFYRTSNTLRRERSLSKALATSDERLVIVEGDPGSGKSVALRHVATMLATRAMKSRSSASVIPIYVNLKEIERRPNETIDRNLIASFVLKVLNRVNDRDIEEFLDEEFDPGLKDGTWFFLFDSFDEIPEILSSTEADKTVRQYATAISDFLHGLNQCRGIIASRFFHGPRQFGWPRFSILPLSSSRRTELVRKANLKPDIEMNLLGQLETAAQEVRMMASNPMFLGLLCEHMRSGFEFPENSHSVFETYVSSRLNRDQERLHKRFELEPPELRATAEAVAFCMAADSGLGLSPSRQDIAKSAQKLQIKLDHRFNKILDALTYLKLARAETSTTTTQSDQFTFAHRRFQEYFSTAVVLREPHRVTPRQLLLDARWRETAVVLFQTQSAEALSPLIREAEQLIHSFVEEVIEANPENPPAADDKQTAVPLEHENPSMRFQWPQHALHVMGLLQEGFTRRLNALPPEMRANVGTILTIASAAGTTVDKKWALDVSGIAQVSVLTELLRQAFRNPSQVVKDSAYRQVAKLSDIPADITYSIRSTLSRMALIGRLRKEKTATHAHLSRLDRARDYLAALRLLIWLPIIDFTLHIFLSLAILVQALSFLSFPLTETHGVVRLAIFIAIIVVPLSWFVLYKVNPSSVFIYLDARTHSIDIVQTVRVTTIFLILQWRTLVTATMIGMATVIYSDKTFGSNPVFSPGQIWVFAALYVSFWAPSALMCVISGRFMSPLLWCFLPILSLGKVFEGVVGIIVAIARNMKRFVRMATFVTVLYALTLALFGVAIKFIPYATVAFGAASVISLLVGAILWLYKMANDALKWRHWINSKPSAIRAEDFIDNIRSYNTKRYRIRFINAVRTGGLLSISADTEEVIYAFARLLETRPPAKSAANRFLTRLRKFLNAGDTEVHKSKHKRERDYVYGVAVFDEVLKLLEQIRVTR